MSSETFKILFSGQMLDGVSADSARGNLKKLLKADDATVARLFSGKTFAIKKGLERSQVEKYVSVLSRAGLKVRTDPPLGAAASLDVVNHEATADTRPADPSSEPSSDSEPSSASRPWGKSRRSKPRSIGFILGIVVGVVVLVAIVGILAAVAIPAYNDYTLRAKVHTALVTANQARDKIAHTMLADSAIPDNNREAGLPAEFSGENLASIEVLPGAIMQVTFKVHSPELDGKTIVWVPEFGENRISWDCSGGTLARGYRPAECREGIHQGVRAPSNLKQFVSVDGRLEMTVPKSWKPEELAEGASVELASLFTEAYLMVYTEPKITLPNHDLSSFGNAVRDVILGNLENSKARYLGSTAVQKLPALNYRIDGVIDGINMIYLVSVVEGKDNFYQIISWSLDTHFSRNENDLKDAIASFRERNSR